MDRAQSVIAVALLAAALLTGCAPVDPAPDATRSTTPAATPSATPTETQADPGAIRDVDFGNLEWVWDTLGEQYTVTLIDGEADAEDPHYEQSAHFTLHEPVFSDANGDGLLDAAVPLQWEAGNGIMENWFIWLAQPDAADAPQQIPHPIGSSARCADEVRGVVAIEGGFRVDETMRDSIESLGACAEVGTMQRSRDVVVAGDGSGAGSWPMTADGFGWGGYCPVKVYTEGEFAQAHGRIGPSDAAPETAATGEKLYSPLQHYPFIEPDGWRLTGFLPDEQVDDSVVCVWLPTS